MSHKNIPNKTVDKEMCSSAVFELHIFQSEIFIAYDNGVYTSISVLPNFGLIAFFSVYKLYFLTVSTYTRRLQVVPLTGKQNLLLYFHV